MADQPSYYETITAAIRDIAEHGYDNAERIAYWERRIREAAERSLGSSERLSQELQEHLYAIYRKLVDGGQALILHPGINRFTLQRIKPHLRLELDRRIVASANLIRLNRREAIDKTLRRFEGWASSVPAGGSRLVDKADEKDNLRKALAQLPFEERRCIVDQGRKLISAVHRTIAEDGGAIAARWHDRFRDPGYNARPEHKHRDISGQVFIIRDNWAIKAGLIKKGSYRYTDEIEQPGELVSCQCSYVYSYGLSGLPPDMLTEKGRAELARVKAVMAGAA